jgi:hypothetical protein
LSCSKAMIWLRKNKKTCYLLGISKGTWPFGTWFWSWFTWSWKHAGKKTSGKFPVVFLTDLGCTSLIGFEGAEIMTKVWAKLRKFPFLFLTEAHLWTCVEGAKQMTEA